MIYTPVFIPTLNRFEHLKQCVDSLNLNHNADKTEVFISVDYPPLEEYVEGHEKICRYLDETKFVFKKLHVFKQTKNLGIGIGSNYGFLIKYAMQHYDRFILSEDDNVFALGYLDFMNEALEKYKDDNSVFSICGYSFYYNLKFDNNNFFRQHSDFNAWGCGYWKEKYNEMLRHDVNYLRKMVYSPCKVLKLWRVSNLQVAHLSSFSRKCNFKWGDNFQTIYMIDHGMTQIMPAKSLVRNIGWDESGQHCAGFTDDINLKHITQEIDESPTFEGLKGTGWEFFRENEKAIREEDFQRCTFLHALNVYLRRVIGFWK